MTSDPAPQRPAPQQPAPPHPPAPQPPAPPPGLPQEDLRKLAIARLRKKREFVQHLTAYVVINLVLNVIWLMTTPG